MQIHARVTKTGGIRMDFMEGPLLCSPIIDPDDVEELVNELNRLKVIAEDQKRRSGIKAVK